MTVVWLEAIFERAHVCLMMFNNFMKFHYVVYENHPEV